MKEDRRPIYSYSGPGLPLLTLCLLLLLACLFCAGQAQRAAAAQARVPVPFNSVDESAGGAVYLDVVGVSDAICPNTGERYYYIAEDSSYLFYIVCLTTDEYAALGTQQLFWNSPDAPAEAVHLTGVSIRIPESVKESVMSFFEMESESFDANFGTRCFLTEAPVEVKGDIGWTLLGMLFALAFLAAIALWLMRLLAVNAAVFQLEEKGLLSAAADELVSNESVLVRGDRLRLGQRFVFGWRCGLAAAWEDVIWCYGRTLRLGRFLLSRVLVIATADGKRHAIAFSAGEEKAMRLLTEQLVSHNEEILLGDSPKNRAAWKRACEG